MTSKRKHLVAPSILSADFANLEKEIKSVTEGALIGFTST